MSREVQLNLFCDMCPKADRVPASSAVTIAISEGERLTSSPRFIDVCEAHSAELKALGELLTQRGVLVQADGRKTPVAAVGATTCPICVEQVSGSNLVEHAWYTHLQTKRETYTTCPECGKEFDTPTGCGSHRRSVHGYDALEYAVELYRARNGQRA